MTMNGVHNEASAPLDLRTTTRNITDRTTKQSKTPEAIDRTPKNEEVESTSRRSLIPFPAIQQGSKECKDSQCQAVKCERLTDSDGKSPDTPTSKLPIRKRPVRPDHKPLDQGQSNGLEPPVKVVKTDSNPCPAKVPKCTNGLNVESQQFIPSSIPGGAQSDIQRAQTTPAYYTFCQSQLTTRILSPPHPHEDTDRLRHEVVLATHQDEDGDTQYGCMLQKNKPKQKNKDSSSDIMFLPVTFTNAETLSAVCLVSVKDLHTPLGCAMYSYPSVFVYCHSRPCHSGCETPLHLAVITHQPSVVQALVQGGADPGALDRNGQTALHLCCEHQQDACLQIILSHLSLLPCCPPTCLDSRNFEGLTPLHLAVQDGNRKMAKMLLDSGADINAVNGCNVNSQSYSGNTALHIACGRGEVEAVRVLLKNGADSSLKNYHNDTAVMVAKNKKVSDVLRGKPTRGHHLQTQNSFNDFPSPNNLSVSPLATSTAHRSASLSPTASRTYSPHSQSGESRSGNLSPVEIQEAENLQMTPRTFHDMVAVNSTDYVVSFYPFSLFPAPPYDALVPSNPHIHLMPGNSPFYPNVVTRHHYSSDTPYILIPARNGSHASRPSPSQPTGTQSRPSSHNSDQTDISNSSAGTGEKT
ncbi:B-cell lymphoma 3 protein [Bagarius yarrelli]|uniref:B-cell lymphoma 3 protein n=1 Tax=Bagarius yarrelli TaxID=175774 RepID=A0A556TQB5_BAGYA|nr:B-cell lymphoma 3 protein [Bagarius yarrelli]